VGGAADDKNMPSLWYLLPLLIFQKNPDSDNLMGIGGLDILPGASELCAYTLVNSGASKSPEQKGETKIAHS